MGACADYKHVCQNLFRGSEDTTHKCLKMPEDTNNKSLKMYDEIEVFDKLAKYEYLYALRGHIQNAVINTFRNNRELKPGDVPDTVEDLFRWYYTGDNRYHNSYGEPELKDFVSKYKDIAIKCGRARQQRRKTHPLVSFSVGILTGVGLVFGYALSHTIYDYKKKHNGNPSGSGCWPVP